MTAHLADATETAAAERLPRRTYPVVHGMVFRTGEQFQRTLTVYVVVEPAANGAADPETGAT